MLDILKRDNAIHGTHNSWQTKLFSYTNAKIEGQEERR